MSPSGVTSNNAVVITKLGDGNPPDGLVVQSLKYDEALGQPFQLVIEFTRKRTGTDLDPAQYYGKQIAVEVSAGIEQKDFKRPFHAIIETFVSLGSDGAEGPWRYRVIGVPWISLLKLTKDNRIHGSDGGDTTAWSLLEAIYKEFNFLRINGKLDIKTLAAPAWSRRTQYNESYFDFVQRLLQQIGGFYFWTHTKDAHTLVPDDGKDLPASFEAHGEISDSAGHGISAWQMEATIQPNRVTANDYDYSKSATWLSVTAVNRIDGDKDKPTATNLPKTRYTVFNFPGGYLEKGTGRASPFAGTQHALRAMDAFECRQIMVRGEAKCYGMSAGFQFRRGGVEYLTTEMSLTIRCATESGPQSDYVHAVFQAMPLYSGANRIYFRPVCDVPAPHIHGVQPANIATYPYSTESTSDATHCPNPQEAVAVYDYKLTVPDAEASAAPVPEKQTGQYARVKVQFRWSRRATETTDWIRMTHLMAGKGWGEFHLPRQGDEVLVAFEYGDPDRPVIVGSLYNDKSVSPVDLGDPKEKDKLAKLFYIRDPGGNLFIMDPGEETHPDHAANGKKQTITLLSYADSARASVQIGHNAEDSPGVPKASH